MPNNQFHILVEQLPLCLNFRFLVKNKAFLLFFEIFDAVFCQNEVFSNLIGLKKSNTSL